MAIDIPLELDSGPITWVKAEIDSALIRALENIERLRATPTEALKNAVRSDLHQVSGAFELVGIEGLAILIQEFEKHFAPEISVVPRESLDLVDRACRRLLSHLKEMAAGTPPVPLRFISEYLALGKLRGAKYGPADLFFPDLSRKPARLESGQAPEPSRMPSFLLRQRRDFQHGLLQWLRGSGDGLEQMRRVIAEIETAYPLPSQRSFWWATHALLEAIGSGVLEPMNAHKQLMARIDLQMRRFVEGSTRVADRLRREVLYHVARARNQNPLVDEVKKLYELDVLVPKRIPREIDETAYIDGYSFPRFFLTIFLPLIKAIAAHCPTVKHWIALCDADKLPADKNALIIAYCGNPKCGAYAAAAQHSRDLWSNDSLLVFFIMH